MNHHSETITRLIDGELSDLERSHFLTSLDEEVSEDWRTLALGLLERQLITDALRKMKEQENSALTIQSKTKASVFHNWVARAALVIFGLMLGFAGPRLIGEKSPQIVAEDPPASTPNDQIPEPELVTLEEPESAPQIRGGYITANFRDGSQLIVPVSHIAEQSR